MWTVRRALLLTFLVVVTIPLTLFWLWPHSRAIHQEVQLVQEKHLLLARNLASALDRYARDIQSAFDFVSDTFVSGRRAEASERLLAGLKIRYVILVDAASGRIVDGIAGTESPPTGSLAPAQIRRFQETVATRTSLPGAVVMAGADDAYMPIVRVLGGRLAVGMVETDYLRELARSLSFGIRGHAVITDHRGQMLANSRSEWETQKTDLSDLAPVQRVQRGETGVEVFHAPAFNETMVAGFTAVPRTGWGVLVPQPLSELTAAAKRIKTSALSIFSLGVILAALIALRFSLLLVKPLQSVINGANRLAKNETDVQISLPGNLVPREFKSLAATFNEMALNVTTARKQEADARAKAERANQQKSEFVRYVTHELRSPVNAILGFARILSAQQQDGRGDAPATAEQIRHIQDAAQHLLSLVNDLLDLSKMEAGQYSLNETELGVDEIVQRCFTMLGEQARSNGIKLSMSMNPPPEIIADERAMYQVLLNLVTNSVRYGRWGGTVDVSAGVREDGGIEIIVADDGPGIAQDDLDRVMKPFERVERGRDNVQGTGLGLPIVKLLIELHGGRFRLSSAVGVGTVAYIYLPASRNLPPLASAYPLAA